MFIHVLQIRDDLLRHQEKENICKAPSTLEEKYMKHNDLDVKDKWEMKANIKI